MKTDSAWFDDTLQSKEQFLQLILENLTDYAFIGTDQNTCITDWEAGAELITGWTKEEIVGSNLSIIFTQEDRQAHVDLTELKRATENGRALDRRWHLRKDGSRFFADGVLIALRDSAGVLQGYAKFFRDATAERQVNDALQNSERRLAALLHSAGEGVYGVDSYGTCTFINAAGAQMLGYEMHELVDKRIHSLIHSRNLEGKTFTNGSPLDNAAKQGIALRVISDVFWRKNDTPLSVMYSVQPILNLNEYPGAVVTFSDVTVQRDESEKLTHNEALFRFLDQLGQATRALSSPTDILAITTQLLGQHLNASRVAFADVAVDGNEFVIRYDWRQQENDSTVGTYSLNDFGTSVGQILKEARCFVISDVDRELSAEDGGNTFTNIGIKAIACCPLIKDNRLVAMMAVHNAEPREWTRSEVSLIEEVVERSWAYIERGSLETKLSKVEEQRRMALEAANLGAWHIDIATMTLQTDARFRQIFGVESDLISYEDVFNHIHPDDRERVHSSVNAVVNATGAANYKVEHRVIHPNGTIRWILANGRKNVISVNQEQSVTSLDGTVLDITERKFNEEELKRLAANLAEAAQRKNEFLATLAHELRNPLAPLRNGLEVMRLTGYNATLLARTQEMMSRQLNHLVHLVDDLLDVARFSSGKIELQLSTVNLKSIVNNAIETTFPLIEAGGHELQLIIPDEELMLHVDPVRIAQVINNLLTNACKYTPEKGKIEIAVEIDGSEAVIRVRDNGVGIPEASFGHLFEIFTQVRGNIQHAQGGLGIGLSLVRRLVELHHGSVMAESPGVGLGSTFTVRLPLLNTTLTHGTAVDENSGDRRTKLLRIFIVDDNADAADSLAIILESQGHITKVFYDGYIAFHQIDELRPDLIFLDIGMPGMSGYDLAKAIRNVPNLSNIKLIALTGWGTEYDKLKSAEAGFDQHFTKPVSIDQITQLLLNISS